LVRRWAASGFDDAFAAISEFEIRCAREHDLVVASESGDLELELAALEREYRRSVVEQFGRIELRGIQTSHRVMQELDVVYVPQHLEMPPAMTSDMEGKEVAFITPQRVAVPTALAAYRHILIVGAPGSGKSTLISYLATRAAAGQATGEVTGDRATLPLVLTVRAMRGASVTARVLASHSGCDPRVVARALRKGSALLLIDGLDEAPEDWRSQLVDLLHRFIRRYPDVQMVVTSRPAGAPGEIEQRLYALSPLRMADLTREEVDEQIGKWCLAAERSVRSDPTEAVKEARRAADDLRWRLSQTYSVQKIATNPLLVTILCVVHRFLGKAIPEHRVTLYEKCTDALFYEWDRAKFQDGAAIGYLDAPAKRRLLMEVARRVHLEHAAEIAEDEVAQHFARTLPDLGRPAGDALQIMAEIRDRSGVLVERRPGFFAFSHLTFQEYLCALDFVRTKSFQELTDRYSESWWQEVIVLAAGVPGASGGVIPRSLLARKAPTATFLAAQCLETEADMPLAVRERIEKAIQRMVPPRDYTEAMQLSKLGAVAAPILAKSLHDEGADSTALILIALTHIDYDPSLPAIARCSSDKRVAKVHLKILKRLQPFVMSVTIGALALSALLFKASKSEMAKILLIDAIDKLSKDDREAFLRSSNKEEHSLLYRFVKAARAGTSRSRHAESTG